MNKERVFGFLFICFIVFFFALLIAEASGYYETKNTKNKVLTEEQIIKFEEDIKNGKEIDISEYTGNNKIDYSNNLSNNIYKISLRLESAVDSTIKIIFNKASKAVNN